jgi:ABC-type branched-subunit amino acid transport system substrate-binding protein
MKKLAQRILSATAGIVMVAGLATAEAAEPIKIGSVLSATGPAAFLGDPEVKTLKLSAGTLNVFRGKNTAHKVATVEGSKDRLIAVFSYYEKPGVVFSREEQIGFYGRAA